MRSDAREAAFKVVYAEQFTGPSERAFRTSLYRKAKLSEEEKAFAEALISCVNEHRDELLSAISERVKRFAEYRLYAVDRAILLIAAAEIFYFDEIPPVVSVSEAAGLARKYSTEKSADFVNGVLGGIINR